jgi:hypothetical protein
VALGGEVVDLVGLHLLHDADQAGGVGQIAVMHPIGVKEARPPLHAVDFVPFLEEEFA